MVSSESLRIHPCFCCLFLLYPLVVLCLSLVASSILGPCKAWDQQRIFVFAGKTRQRASDSRDYLSVCFACLDFCTHGFEEGLEHFSVESGYSGSSIMLQHYSISFSIEGVLEPERVSVAANHLHRFQCILHVEFLEPE